MKHGRTFVSVIRSNTRGDDYLPAVVFQEEGEELNNQLRHLLSVAQLDVVEP